MGALITDAGPNVGEKVARFDLTALDGRAVTIGAAGARSQLVFFLSPTCPVCKKLLFYRLPQEQSLIQKMVN